jgi:hypothetical protein
MVEVEVAALTSQPTPSRARLRVTRTEYRSAPVPASGTAVAGLKDLATPQPDRELDYCELYRIKGELPGGYWLDRSLPVQVHVEGSEYVALQPQLALHAFGVTPVDAIMNLREELVEHYQHLNLMGDRLGPQLLRQRELLRRLLTAPNA